MRTRSTLITIGGAWLQQGAAELGLVSKLKSAVGIKPKGNATSTRSGSNKSSAGSAGKKPGSAVRAVSANVSSNQA